jgi:peptide/nickel transport system substrate-binding protein
MLGLAVAVPLAATNTAVAEDPYYRMIVGVAQDPDELNPFAMILSISYTIDFLAFDTLTSVEPDLSPGPQLASNWESSVDGKLWTFNIVENAVWHDGEQVTAEDIEFTFNLILDNPKDCALWIDYLSNVTRVEAVDTYTLEIETEVPKATMLSIMIPILPEHLWSLVPTKDIAKVSLWDTKYFPDGPVGSGPLILSDWDSIAGEVIMLKNPDYFIDTVKVDEVLFKSFGNQEVMTNSLWSGTIDVAMDVPAMLWDDTLARDGIGGQKSAALSFYELGVNCASEEWREEFPQASDNLETTNLSVRQAIAMVTDKDYIVEDVLLGLAEVGESIIPTATSYWHYDVPPEDRWDLDFDRANALLDAAGYPYDDDIRANETSGVELDFSLYYRRGYLDEEKAAFKIAENLDKIGINVRLEDVSEGVLYNVWLGCQYDLFIWGWDCDVDPNFMLSTMTEAQQPLDPQDFTKWGDAFWINEEYEQMYIDQQMAVDKEDRQAIIFEMQKLLYYECPYIVLYYPMGLYAYNTDDFTNYPDMETYAGTTPGTMWFFFEVTPMGEWVEEFPPENVDAGPDQRCVVGETLAFIGYAEDQDNLLTELTWSWSFIEPNGTIGVAEGQDVTYTFENAGDVTVILSVTDPAGGVSDDELVVNVSEMSDTAGLLQGYVKDSDSDPVSGVMIDAVVNNRTTFPADAELPEGFYSMALESDEYAVTASKPGWGEMTLTASVTAGNTTWLNFTLDVTSGTLEGFVFNNVTGEVISSATVKVTCEDGTVKTFTTSATGFYQFSTVPEGSATVNVTKAGYETNSTVVTIVAGETTTLDVNLDPVEETSSSGSLWIAVAAILAIVAIAAAAFMLLRKKGKGKGDDGLSETEPIAPEP